MNKIKPSVGQTFRSRFPLHAAEGTNSSMISPALKCSKKSWDLKQLKVEYGTVMEFSHWIAPCANVSNKSKWNLSLQVTEKLLPTMAKGVAM